jgi:hypothetical protein
MRHVNPRGAAGSTSPSVTETRIPVGVPSTFRSS